MADTNFGQGADPGGQLCQVRPAGGLHHSLFDDYEQRFLKRNAQDELISFEESFGKLPGRADLKSTPRKEAEP